MPMPSTFAEGDRIQVVDRDPVAADVKSQLYYHHYRGLTGSIAKIYADGTASVNVDPASLSKDISTRHASTSDSLRQKWLDSLSEEARNKLSGADKNFTLRYTILIALSDLEPYSAPVKTAVGIAAKAATAVPAAEPSNSRAGTPAPHPEGPESVAEPARKTLAEIEAEEARHLEEIARQGRAGG
jgi:hypothetical protein